MHVPGLSYLQGLTNREIAVRLACPMGTVATWLARGRALLRKRLVRQGVALPAAPAEDNQLHILSVGANNMVSEPSGPILLASFGVPATAPAQGIAIVAGYQGRSIRCC